MDSHITRMNDKVTIIVPLIESYGNSRRCLESIGSQTCAPDINVMLIADEQLTGDAESSYCELLQSVASVEIRRDLTLTNWVSELPQLVTTDYFLILEPFDVLAPDAIDLLYSAITTGAHSCAMGRRGKNGLPVPPAEPHSGYDYADFWLSCKLFRTKVLPELSSVLPSITSPLILRGVGLPLMLVSQDVVMCDSALVERGSRKTQRIRNSTVDSVELDLEWARNCLLACACLSVEDQTVVHRQVILALGSVLLKVRQHVPPDQQESFYTKCHSALGPILTEDNVFSVLTSVHEQNCMAAISLEMPDVLFAQYTGTVYVHIEDCGAYIIPEGLPLEWKEAFSSNSLSAFVEYAETDEGHLLLAGIVNVPWASLSDTSGLSCMVHVGAAYVSEGRWRPREERLRQPDNSAFVCRVPLELRSDDYPLQFVLSDRDGRQVTHPLGMTAGALRSSRRSHDNGCYWQIVPKQRPHFIAMLRLRRSRGTWMWQSLRDLFVAVRHHFPYAKHRLILALARIVTVHHQIWLVGERRDTAQDNGWVLFQYVRENRPRGVSAFYVLDQRSSMWDSAKALGHVVAHGSWQHKLICIIATHLVSSQDIDSFLLPEKWVPLRHRIWFVPYQQAHRVFLQHGIIINGVGQILRRGATGLSLFVCSCEAEKKYLESSTRGYTDRQLQLTGLPRFDALSTASNFKQRLILLAPTWRRNLTVLSSVINRQSQTPVVPFAESEYRSFFLDFLRSDLLANALQEYDYRLVFVPHYEVRDQWAEVDQQNGRIQIMDDGGQSIAALLRACQLFITDYSSTQFDAALGGARIIYTTFDAEEFFTEHYKPGWFDQRYDGFGEEITNVDALVSATIKFMAGDPEDDCLYRDRLAKLHIVCDGNNTARAVEAIRKLSNNC